MDNFNDWQCYCQACPAWNYKAKKKMKMQTKNTSAK